MSISDASLLNSRPWFGHRLLPHDCLLCGAATGETLVCAACAVALPHHHAPACPQCAVPASGAGVCGRCLVKPPAFDRTVAAFDYRYPLAEVLHAYKYGGRLAVGRFLADALLTRVRDERWPELLLPMPLFSARLRERGFNQAAEIARHLARATGLPLSLTLLDKIRDTAPQASLPWKARSANVKGAFVCAADLDGKRLAIVDDVMTTGATLNEAARMLKRQGAAEVAVWVVARTLPDRR